MIVPAAALVAVLVPLLLGGRAGRFAVVRLLGTQVVVAGFVVQFVALEVLPGPRWLLTALHVGSYFAAGVFVWANRRVPGLAMIGLGALSNGVTILLNGGVLPADPDALTRAGLAQSPHLTRGLLNSDVVHAPRLAFLGDVFAVPAGVPLANVFSIGDLLIVLGAGWASYRICGTRWSRPWRPADAGHAKGRHLAGVFTELVTGANDPDAARPPSGRRAAARPPARRALRPADPLPDKVLRLAAGTARRRMTFGPVGSSRPRRMVNV